MRIFLLKFLLIKIFLWFLLSTFEFLNKVIGSCVNKPVTKLYLLFIHEDNIGKI